MVTERATVRQSLRRRGELAHLGRIPQGFAEPVVVMQDANAGRMFEASNVYELNGTGQYLALPGGSVCSRRRRSPSSSREYRANALGRSFRRGLRCGSAPR